MHNYWTIAGGRGHSFDGTEAFVCGQAGPDISTAVSFLTTRVTKPTVEDDNKLIHVLRYLRGTKDLALHISGSDGMLIISYIDSSFAIHPDGKGHTGAVISIGVEPYISSQNSL